MSNKFVMKLRNFFWDVKFFYWNMCVIFKYDIDKNNVFENDFVINIYW